MTSSIGPPKAILDGFVRQESKEFHPICHSKADRKLFAAVALRTRSAYLELDIGISCLSQRLNRQR